MIMRHNSEFGNECNHNGRCSKYYGYETEPLGYNKLRTDCTSSFNKNTRCDYDTNEQYHGRVGMKHDIGNKNLSTWLDNWGLSNYGGRGHLIASNNSTPGNFLSDHGNIFGMHSLSNMLPHLFSGAMISADKLFQHQLDDNMIVTDNGREYEIAFAIPGCDSKDVSVNVCEENGNNYLEIRWHYSKNSKSNYDHVLWMGKSWGSGSKRLPIPPSCNKEAIHAGMRDGVLNVCIPKSNTSNRRANGGKGKSINIC